MSQAGIVERLAYRPRPDGPHARLGVVWFVLAVGACVLGYLAVGVLFACVAVLAVLQLVRAWAAHGRRGPFTLVRCAFLPATTVASVALLAYADMGAMVILLLLVSAYEIGDYLMGAEANGVLEGPVSGMAAVLVTTFAVSVLQLGPFDMRTVWVFGALVAVLAPFGAVLASAIAPSADEAGTALRRLDAWIVVAPVWAWLLLVHLGRIG